MTFGSLFAGIGGFDLGFERAGMTCKWQVEIDPYANRVLQKHWPQVPRHGDIRTFPTGCVDDWRVDVICGGFPCQDISYAGKGAGLAGERSGLFYEAMRVIREVEPRYVVLENVAALLTRGLDQVLGTLASFGFDAEWHCIPAAAVGAPHIRDRVFIVGYRDCADANGRRIQLLGRGASGRAARRDEVASRQWERLRSNAQPVGEAFPDTTNNRIGRGEQQSQGCKGARDVAYADGLQSQGERSSGQQVACARRSQRQLERCGDGAWQFWATEPDVGRVANGIPKRVDRLRGLGNAVVPQVAEWIGRRLVEFHNQQ